MNDEIKYPKTIDMLLKKIDYIVNEEENEYVINGLTKWKDWFKNLNYELNYQLNSNQYIKAYFDENINALQVWEHNDNVDSIVINLVSSDYSLYDDDNTLIYLNSN